MKYVVESSYIDAHEKLYYILQYIQLKSYYTNNKTANMKDKNIAISAKFLLRHIWNGLLESLRYLFFLSKYRNFKLKIYSDSVHSCKSLLSNTLWKNLSYLIYFTQEIVSSIYNPQPLSPGFKQKCVEIYPSLNKCVTEINEKEKIPTSFLLLFS